jgi:acyl-CoA reductase-like NAD-dependent aldehyde dehydrogenase
MSFPENGLIPTMTVAGLPAGSAERVPVMNPANGRTVGSVPVCDREVLEQAMDSAQAVVGWGTDDDRRSALRSAATVLENHADELAGIVTAEQGKPMQEARAEVGECVRWLSHFAELELQPELIDADGVRAVVRREPVGVVAAIVPWNFPLSTAFWKIAPALRAGDSVVLKPSPFTPLSALRAGELLRGVLPDGTVNVLAGGDELGVWMTCHPTPRLISFTGSSETGKAIARSAAQDLKRLVLELGGNDPAILLEDLDIQRTIRPLFWAAFYNCGQVCAGVKRVYAPRAIYADVVEGLAAYADSLPVGDGAADETRIGPINNRIQRERVAELVAQAVGEGARVANATSDVPDVGFFYRPTIVASAVPDSRLVLEEQFGPALPVVPYDSLDQAIEWANGTRYGLGSSVWSGDPERARETAPALRAGTTWINTHAALSPRQPFAGRDWSGLGVENGRAGFEALTASQVISERA